MNLVITRRRLIVSGLALLLLGIILFAASSGIVVINPPANATSTSFVLKHGSSTKKMTLGTKRKILLLSPGVYTVEFSNGDKTSGYGFSPRRFLLPKTINIILKDQLSGEGLGIATQGCGFDSPGSQVSVYYDCGVQSSRLPQIFDGNTVSYLSLFNVTSEELLSYSSPYMGGLLTVIGAPSSKEASFNQLDANNGKNTLLGNIILPDSLNSGSYSLVTDEDSPSNPLVVLYAQSKQSLLIFDSSSSKDYRTIPVPRSKDIPEYIVRLRLMGQKLYVLRGLAPDYNYSEEAGASKSFPEPQSLSITDVKSGKVERDIKLDNKFRAGSLYVSPGGQIVVYGYAGNSQIGKLYQESNGKLVELKVLNDVSDSIAWSSDRSFYYVSGNRVFKYSPLDNSSFLVYADKNMSISKLKSINKNIFVVAFAGSDKSANYIRLTDKPSVGKRPEAVFPFRNDAYHSILSVSFYKGTIYIKTYPANDAEKTKSSIKDYVKSLGIDTGSYKIEFTN